jgi:hypothetical protein
LRPAWRNGSRQPYPAARAPHAVRPNRPCNQPLNPATSARRRHLRRQPRARRPRRSSHFACSRSPPSVLEEMMMQPATNTLVDADQHAATHARTF